jgi:hypothetical protein
MDEILEAIITTIDLYSAEVIEPDMLVEILTLLLLALMCETGWSDVLVIFYV